MFGDSPFGGTVRPIEVAPVGLSVGAGTRHWLGKKGHGCRLNQ